MTTRAAELAAERRLEWLLDEVLGGIGPGEARAGRATTAAPAGRWLAAAVALLAAGAAIGAFVLQRSAAPAVAPATQGTAPAASEPVWREAHSAADLAALPRDTANLRCFAFDDAAVAKLAAFPDLERLDLGGMEPDAAGITYPPEVTDASFHTFGALTKLRWLGLGHCERLTGAGLGALEALPLLEHLDVTYTQISSAAIERLPRLPSLRELSLANCLKFHGRSLADVAKIPGLRRLSLRGCSTVTAGDVMQLAALRELRWLDLHDCMGRYGGQTLDLGGPAPTDAPKEDHVGVTDAAIAALAGLPIEHLDLGGCSSLTDGVGEALAKFAKLRELDLSELPKATAALVAHLPPTLTSLSLLDLPRLDASLVDALPTFTDLRELRLPIGPFDPAGLLRKTGRRLEALTLGTWLLTPGTLFDHVAEVKKATTFLAAQQDLRTLRLGERNDSVALLLEAAARLPKLRDLEITPRRNGPCDLRPFAGSRTLRRLGLGSHFHLTEAALEPLAEVPLQELDVRGSKCDPARLRAFAAAHWPGCTITLPDGQKHVVPAK